MYSFLPKTNANISFKLVEMRNFKISVSSDAGKNNPHKQTPAITNVVKLGPRGSDIKTGQININIECVH